MAAQQTILGTIALEKGYHLYHLWTKTSNLTVVAKSDSEVKAHYPKHLCTPLIKESIDPDQNYLVAGPITDLHTCTGSQLLDKGLLAFHVWGSTINEYICASNLLKVKAHYPKAYINLATVSLSGIYKIIE